MRRIGIGLFILIVSVSFCGCNRHEPQKDFSFDLSTTSLEFTEEAGYSFVSVHTAAPWYIEEHSPSWLHVTASNENSNIVVSVDANDDTDSRSSNVVIHYGNRNAIATVQVTQSPRKVLAFDCEKVLDVPNDSCTVTLTVKNNVPYGIASDADWAVVDGQSQSIAVQSLSFENRRDLRIAANSTAYDRECRIVIFNESCRLSDTLRVFQRKGYDKPHGRTDCSWFPLQTSCGPGPCVVIMGDGFTEESFSEGGLYDDSMAKAMEHFFSIEPFRTFRSCFNVYQVNLVSLEPGVSEGKRSVNNRLGSRYGEGTAISCDSDLCMEYVTSITDIPLGEPVTVIVVLNDDKYAGTTYMFQDGSSIALCPMSRMPSPNDFEGVVHHEAGGHGFGFLNDEYVYHQSKFPDDECRQLLDWQEKGYMLNLDINYEPTLWKDILDSGLYPEAGMFEGGGLYQFGVWRCEENSCMNNNIPYFNVQSRRVIIDRIMKYSGRDYSFEDFLSDDKNLDLSGKPVPSTKVVQACYETLPPLAPPVLVTRR